MAPFADHFSGHASAYAASRPRYPDALFDWLASVAPAEQPRRAWDCGTGNGQAAVALGRHFETVIATDPSFEQLRHAAPHPRVGYIGATAEATPIAGGAISLVTVAQALHWFDLERFYAEVRRTASGGAVIAAWTYAHSSIDPETDALLHRFNMRDLAGWWPRERWHVDDGYASLPFPFTPIDVPSFEMSTEWTLGQTMAYVRTWSAVAAARRGTGQDPVDALERRLEVGWPRGERRTIRWPLTLLAGWID